MANTYAYSKAESDAKNQETFREIKQTTEAISAGEGGKLYDTLADAQALDPKPVDGTVFQVSKIDAENSGIYSFQSSDPLGTRFERDLELIESVKDTSSNLYNPSTRSVDSTISPSTGEVSSSTGIYDVSDFIEVEAGEEYHFLYNVGSPSVICRRVVYFDGNKNYMTSEESPSTVVVPENAHFVRCLFPNENNNSPLIPNQISFSHSSVNQFEPYYVKYDLYKKDGVKLATIEDIPSPSESASAKSVTFQNSDKILYTGSSSVEGFYQPKGKLWAHKVQDFIDYVFIPYGWSGNSAQDIADKILTDTPSPSASGVLPSDIKPTFTFVGQTLNDEGEQSNPTDDEYVGYLEKLLKACRMLGGKPIVGTAYKSSNKINLETTLAELAYKYDAYYMPTSRINDLIYDHTNAYHFYGSAHPGIRTNELYTTPTLQYLKNLKAPKQAILVFNARNPLNTNEDLVVTDNYERAKKFKTIAVGEKHLINSGADRYDSLTPVDYSISGNTHSEWLALMKGQNVSLKNKALIEFILPVVGTDEISIEISGEGISKYHLLNNVTNTWDEVSLVDGSIKITAQKYTDFDKVRLLITGSDITMNDAKAFCVGGSEKERKETSIETLYVGTVIRDSRGFDLDLTGFTNSATNEVYLPSVKYGEEFNDLPQFINMPDKAIVVLGGEPLSYEVNSSGFDQIYSMGYRKLRATFCARINPKIYNPTEYANWVGANNPYTNVSWYEEDSYDFATIVFALENGQNPNPQAKRNVGLFWTYQSVDILLPPKSVSLDLKIHRDMADTINADFPMEICDLIIEII